MLRGFGSGAARDPQSRNEPWLHLPRRVIWRGRSRYREATKADFQDFMSSGDRIALHPRPSPRVTIIVVLFNQADLSWQCLRALSNTRDTSFETIIIDNASSDETAALLDRIDGATIVRNQANVGFLEAVNQAAALVSTEYMLLLNNDAVPLPQALSRAVGRLDEDRTIGAVGARLVDAYGRLQEAGAVVWKNGFTIGYGAGQSPNRSRFRIVRDVDSCCGAFLMTRTALFAELGCFDKAFAPAYYEETDYCFRLRRAGHRVVYDPGVRVLHYIYGSASSLFAPFRQMSRNKLQFREKHRKSLGGRPDFSLLGFIRAVFGLKVAPWVLVVVPSDHGTPERDYRAAGIANRLVDRGWFVTVFRITEAMAAVGGAFQSRADETHPRPRNDMARIPRRVWASLDAVVVTGPASYEDLIFPLAKSLPVRNLTIVCDSQGFSGEERGIENVREQFAQAGLNLAVTERAAALLELQIKPR